MDQTEEVTKFLGFFGIFIKSFKTIFSSKKLFTQITLTFILLLALIFILQTEISLHFFLKLDTKIRNIDNNTIPYNTNDSQVPTITNYLYSALLSIAYFILLAVFSPLATSAVVFTVAAVYTGRDVNFRTVTKLIPKVWKRLFITSVFVYITQFIFYTIIVVAITIIPRYILFLYSGIGGLITIFILLVLYMYGYFYLTVVCQLAGIVTVFEHIYGFKALKKGMHLVNGKKKVGMGIAFVLEGVLLCIYLVYILLVRDGDKGFRWKLIWRVLMGILCGMMLLMLDLLFIVTHTVLYLVCKSYHWEVVDKLSLSRFLDAYIGETVVGSGSGVEVQQGSIQPAAQQV